MGVVEKIENNEQFLKTVRDTLKTGDKKAIDTVLDQIALRYGNIAKNFLEAAIDRYKLSPDQIVGIFNKMIEHLDTVQKRIEKRINERANSNDSSNTSSTKADKVTLIDKYSSYAEMKTHKHCMDENHKELKRLKEQEKELALKLRKAKKAKNKEEEERLKEEMKRNKERQKELMRQNGIHQKRMEELKVVWTEFKSKNPEIASDIEKMWKENEGNMKESWEKYKAQNPEAAGLVSEFCLSHAKKTFNRSNPSQTPRQNSVGNER